MEPLLALDQALKYDKLSTYLPYGHPDTLCPDGRVWKAKHAAGEWASWSNKPWQMEFHAAGLNNQERMLEAANRPGKTECAAAEVAMHMTGIYPSWWPGRRFTKPVLVWTGSPTNETSRDIVQKSLLGGTDSQSLGSGWIPRHCIHGRPKQRQAGVADVIDQFTVQHISGGYSKCILKCHTKDQRVLMADGRWIPIVNVEVGDSIRCADGLNRIVDQKHAYLKAPVIEIVTRSGVLRGTPNHPTFTNRGKLRLDEIQIGDVLEIADCDCGESIIDDWVIIWTALMIGDGCLREKTPIITCAEPEILSEAESYLPDDLYIVKRGTSRPYDYKVSSNLHKRNRLKESLVNDGLWGRKSNKKFIPEWVFTLNREQRILFLRWLWTTDGTVQNGYARYDSSSGRLSNDVQALLWSVGIHCRVVTRPPQNPKYNNRNYVELSGHERVAFQEIGKLGRDNSTNITPRPKGERGEVLEINILEDQTVIGVGIPDVHELIVEGFRTGNTFEQGWRKWQGTEPDIVWLDEEPDQSSEQRKIFTEALTRLLTSHGSLLITFTPLLGQTDLVLHFEENQGNDGIWLGKATWDDAPHLIKVERERLMMSYPEWERDARTKGIPLMGEGRIFTLPENDILCEPFELPPHYVRIIGIDFGLDHPAAAGAIAYDRDRDIIFLYDCYKKSNEDYVYHASAIKSMGGTQGNIPVSWPHDGADREKGSGVTLKDMYRREGVNMLGRSARYDNDKGGSQSQWPIIEEIMKREKTGRFKVFRTCGDYLEERRSYHTKDGKIIDRRDDVLKATFYAVMMKRYAISMNMTQKVSHMPAPFKI